MNLKSRVFSLALIFGLISAVFLSLADFSASCDDLRNNVLRLHIIANSDSEKDQNLKLLIRDEILSMSETVFSDSNSLDEAVISAECSCEQIESIANRVIKENGFDYTAKVRVGDSYFETRVYDDFTLPAGTYKSLIVDLGAGKGKNWWCVIFPQVCLPIGNDASLKDSAKDGGAEIAYGAQRYIMRFKAEEIYEEIKNLLK